MENAFYSLEGLFQFLNEGVSPFHAAAAAAKILESQGYVHCPEKPAWTLAPGGKYYTTRNGSAVIAWRMPTGCADRLARSGQPQRCPHLAHQGAGRRQG